VKQGFGKDLWKNTKNVYLGNFDKGIMSGFGSFTWSNFNSRQYVGEW